MSEYRSFKLLVRVVGLLLVGLGLPTALYTIAGVYSVMNNPTGAPAGTREWGVYLLNMSGYWLQVAFGFYLTFFADRLIHYFIRDVRDNCLRCGYSIKTLSTNLCPECGEVVELPPKPGTTLAPALAQTPPQSPESPKNQG